jgi:hypothetical protein
MNPRNSIRFRQVSACLLRPETRRVPSHVQAGLPNFINWLCGFILGNADDFTIRRNGPSLAAANQVEFPFPLLCDTLNSGRIRNQTRGFAVCVKRPFFLRQPPRFPLLAALAIQMRQPITPLCAPSVVQLQARLLQTRLAAAKLKGRLLARLLVVLRAALVRRAATNTGPSTGLPNNALIASFNGADTVFHKAIRGNSPSGLFVFPRLVRASEKGLLCLRRS